MQVDWKYRSLQTGCGHGVEVGMNFNKATDRQSGTVLAFIEGFSWLHDTDPSVNVYLDENLKEFPEALTSEIRLAILLFLTDKNLQTEFMTTIHGYSFWING